MVAILSVVDWTPVALDLTVDLLELVYERSGAVRSSRRGIGYQFELAGGIPPVTLLPIRAEDPDWIPAIVGCEPIWIDTMGGQDVQTNLFSLFGLPSSRSGLVALWESTYGRSFPPEPDR